MTKSLRDVDAQIELQKAETATKQQEAMKIHFVSEVIRHLVRSEAKGEFLSVNRLRQLMHRQYDADTIREGVGYMEGLEMIEKVKPASGPGRPSVKYRALVKP